LISKTKIMTKNSIEQSLPEDLQGLSIVRKRDQYKSEREEIIFLDKEEEFLSKKNEDDLDINISEDPLYKHKYRGNSLAKSIADASTMYQEDESSSLSHKNVDTTLMRRSSFK